MQAAKYLSVAPWELAKQPLAWMEWALTALAAEGEAQELKVNKGRGEV